MTNEKKQKMCGSQALFPATIGDGRAILECLCDRAIGHKGLHRALVTQYLGIKNDEYLEGDTFIYWEDDE